MLTVEDAKKIQDEATQREIFDLRVLVVGGGFQYLKMFFDAGLKGATSVDDADIICFTGGEDVDPALYGEKAIPETYFNTRRDEVESRIYGEAVGLRKPMVGICRGAQFLNVMNGGKLWQDVNAHLGAHTVLDVRTGEYVDRMTSTHHQMMRPADDGEVLAVASLSTSKKCDGEHLLTDAPVENSDVEVVWYPASMCLCFQPHPEFSHGNCRNYFLDLFDQYVIPATS